MIFKTGCLLIASIFLLACGTNDTGGLPPERPAGTISGQAVAAGIANAQVTVYGFGDGARGARLGSSVSDDSGAYAIDIRAPSQAILVEVSGGRYEEEASGATVALEEGQTLRAVGHYVSGQPLTLMVTPLTHMAAALAEYKFANGMAVGQATDEANAAVDQFFAMDTRTTRPALITTAGDTLTTLENDTLYGFYLAGLSNWTLWAGMQNQAGQPHATYNSMSLAQIIYHDLRSDGLLDGMGFDQDATALVPLGFGNVALNADVYRLAFSLHMLAMANSTQNKTGLVIDELLDAAHAIATQVTMLPADASPVAIDGQAPVLTLQQVKQIGNEETLLNLEQFINQAHSGTFLLRVTVGGLLGAESLTSAIRDSGGNLVKPEIVKPMHGSGQILVIVDSTDYADGEYTFELRAEDALGKTTTETFNVKFDNTGPVIAVTSPRSTNQPTVTLSGTFSDNIAGVASITVAGQAATLFTDDTWRIDDVAIMAGKNIIPISVVDLVGNRRDDFVTEVYLDDIPPLIDSQNKHGQARFSNGDGTSTTGQLLDSNAALDPLYVESNSVDLGGVLIDRTALDASTIPYFAFTVSDDMAPNTATAADAIQVQIQYRRNGQILSPWHTLASVGGEYLIPLTSETLATDWHRTTPNEQHIINVEVTDPAGNKTAARFDFYADIYVPAFDIANNNGDASNSIDDVGQPLFANTLFTERATLNDLSFASTAYTFTNTAGKAFYISLNDDSLHSTAQTVDKLLREHRVHVKATPEWRVGLMTPTDNCPDFDPVNGTWQYPTSVWNWNGISWVQEQVAGPGYGTEEAILEDVLPADPVPSTWSDVADFDQESWVESISDPLYLYWTRGFDILLDPNDYTKAATLVAWTRQLRSTGVIESCNPKRYFQQRETYAYESVTGYPKGVLSAEVIANTPNFTTTSYTLTDNDSGTTIAPVNGWYRIPAGHSVTIEKWVTTPGLTLYNDDISNVNSFPSYDTPNRLDKTISWFVVRNLGITFSHDAGKANISAMPARSMTVGENTMTYQISR